MAPRRDAPRPARSRVPAAAIRRRRADIAEARNCPLAYAEYVGGISLADVHRKWLKMWRDEPQSVVHSSVGLGKSTLARLFIQWLLGNDPNERVIWIGATQKQPRQSLAAISSMIEMPSYRSRVHHVFPELRPGRVWRSTEIEILRDANVSDSDPNLSVYGAFADSILGSRATTVVLDDICTWANTLTEDGRQKMIEWLGSVFSRLTKDRVRVIALGNYWHKDDALNDLVRSKGFAYSRDPAYRLGPNDERIPTAPQCLSLEKIARLERQLGALQAERMLLCRAASIELGRFRSPWFARALEDGRGFPFRPPAVRGACYTGVDLGYTKKLGNDLTSMVTCMVLEEGDNAGRRLIVDVRSGHWSAAEVRSNLAEVRDAYHPIIGVESNGAQRMVSELLSEMLAIPLIDRETNVNKYHYATGVESLANEVAMGFWIFPCPPHPQLDQDHGYIEPGPLLPAEWSLDHQAGGQPHHEVQELINQALVYDPSRGRSQHTGDRLMAWWICAETLRNSATGVLLGQPSAIGMGDFDWMAR